MRRRLVRYVLVWSRCAHRPGHRQLPPASARPSSDPARAADGPRPRHSSPAARGGSQADRRRRCTPDHRRHGRDAAPRTSPSPRAGRQRRRAAGRRRTPPPVDLLVNNAGVWPPGEFLLSADLGRTAAPARRQRRGRAADLTSRSRCRAWSPAGTGAVGATSPASPASCPPADRHYGADKAWAVALHRGRRGVAARHRPQITVVCPGFVRTASLHTVPRDASFRQRFLLLAPDQVARRALADLRAGARCPSPRSSTAASGRWLELSRRALRAVARLTGHGRDRPGVPARRLPRCRYPGSRCGRARCNGSRRPDIPPVDLRLAPLRR